MVKIRLRRTGAKKKPSYRLVVTDERAPRNGRFIEIIGHYNPRTEPITVNIHEDRALYWLSEGAQPTDTVKKLLQNLGTLDRFVRLKEGADFEELVAEAQAASQENAEDAQPVEKAEQAKTSISESVSDEATELVEETSSQAEAVVEAEAVKDEA